jgi:hypothetical protein
MKGGKYQPLGEKIYIKGKEGKRGKTKYEGI